MKKLFISQPMRGKTNEEIEAVRADAQKMAEKRYGEKFEVINSFFKDEPHDGNQALYHLGKSIMLLSQADVAYFCEGWNKSRGCLIEASCASFYGIHLMLSPEENVRD